MARIVLATFGSLGDLHPMIALGIELRRRGHLIAFNTLEVYREKMDALDSSFFRCALTSIRKPIKRSPAR
jgi:UDP:flavonoid glycosyltransferase YjiC (YdhE family)